MHLLPHNYAEIAAAIICTICLLYKPSVINRWFVGFLWLTVAVELIAKQLNQNLDLKNSMYNVFNIIEFVFYLLFLAFNIGKKRKRFLLPLAIAIAIIGIINFLLGQQEKKYNHYTTMIGSIMITLACLVLYKQLLFARPQEKVNISLLIISFGLLIFYVGNFLIYSFYDTLLKNDPDFLVKLYHIVNGNLNVIMYACFALAFIIEALPKSLQRLVPS